MKKTKAEKRAEEARIIAEMDEAMQGVRQNQTAQTDVEKSPENPPKAKRKARGVAEGDMPEKLHCKRCKTLMENGVCPTCGFKVYIPMQAEKRNKIKLILTAVLMVAFVALFVVMQFIK